MQLHNRFLKTILHIILFVFYSLFIISLISLYIPPHIFWPAGFFTFLIVAFIVINIPVIVFCFLLKSRWKWIGIMMLLVSAYYIPVIYQLNKTDDEIFNKGIKVLSYNISGYSHLKDKKSTEEIEMWVVNENPDILCLQEYYPPKREIKKKRKKGDKYKKTFYTLSYLDQFFPYQFVKANEKMIGVVIFSKYKILNSGIIYEGHSNHNKGIFADVLINTDTVRIINVHFESNKIALSSISKSKESFLNSIKTIKTNQARRSNQAEVLVSFIKRSPYPIILTGDFNETPFSYAYYSVRKLLNSGFEAKGKGLGATFKPDETYLRIDHQFYSPEIEIEEYNTLNETRFSDHIPISGSYIIR